MFNISICDDDQIFLTILSKKIKKMAERNDISINLYQYVSGDEMLFDIESNSKYFDIYFLDVLMDNIGGIEIAKKLRDYKINAQIIFLTSSKEHVFEALDFMPLHYLIKQNVNDDMIEQILLKAVALAKNGQKQNFIYKVGHSINHIEVCDIMYFEVFNRIIKIHCTDGQIVEFYNTIKELEKEVDNKLFIRIHRSFLVNISHISTIKGNEIVLNNQETLSIGEKYRKKVIMEYSKYMLDQI